MSRPSDTPETDAAMFFAAEVKEEGFGGHFSVVQHELALRLERSRNYWKRRALKAESERDDEQGERVRSSFGVTARIEAVTPRAGETFMPNGAVFKKKGRTHWRKLR